MLIYAALFVFAMAFLSEMLTRKLLPASWWSACGFIFGASSVIIALVAF